MEAVLIDGWLGGAEAIPVLDEASVSVVREGVRRAGVSLGLSETVVGSIVTAASELAHNQLVHARDGVVAVRVVDRDGVPGLEVVAADVGRGIQDPEAALRGGGGSRTGLGIGLVGVRALCDELDMDVRLGEGSCVWARKFAEPVPRRREVGIFGRPHPAEDVSGDHAAFVRRRDVLSVALADGLGHGPHARKASEATIECFRAGPERSLDALLAGCHDAALGTRGAVMSVARLEEPSGKMETASIGNVTVHVSGPDVAHRFGGTSAVLGMRGQARAARVEQQVLSPWEVLLVFSDGITSRASVEQDHALLREHPVVVAQAVVQRFARGDDDVLVLAVR